MNRRDFFSVVGAALVGGVAGKKTTYGSRDAYSWELSDLHTDVFVQESVNFGMGSVEWPYVIDMNGERIFATYGGVEALCVDAQQGSVSLCDPVPSCDLYVNYYDAWL